MSSLPLTNEHGGFELSTDAELLDRFADDRQELLHAIDWAVKELDKVMHQARVKTISRVLQLVANKVKGATNDE